MRPMPPFRRNPGHWLWLAAAVLAAAGCASFTDLDDFQRIEGITALMEGDGPVIEGGARTITVTETITVPNPCYTLSARLRRDDRELVLRVIATGGGACPAVVGHHPYHARIADLHPGDYRLVLIHAYPGTGWPERVSVHEVSVGG